MAQFTRNALDTTQKIKHEIITLQASLPRRPISSEIEGARSFLMKQQDGGFPADMSSCKLDENIKSPDVPQEFYDLFEECLIKHNSYRFEHLKLEAMTKIAVESFYEVSHRALNALAASTTELPEPPVKQVAHTSSHALDAGSSSSTMHIAEPRVQEVALNPLCATSTEISEPPVQEVAQSTEIVRLEPVFTGQTVLGTAAGHPSDIEELNFITLQDTFLQCFQESTEILSLQSRLSNEVDQLPPHFYLLATFLNEVHLSGNNLHVLPVEIGSFSRLTILNVERNQIKFISDEIVKCKALKELRAGHNRLSNLPEMPANLEILLVPHNRLRRLPDSMGTLTELDVSGNLLASIPGNILAIKSIVKLRISINRHLTHLPNTIQRGTMLEELDISSTLLRSLPDTLGYATKLHTFKAEMCPDLKHPPRQIVSEGPQDIVRYMERRHKKFKRRLNRGLKKAVKFVRCSVEKVGNKENVPPILEACCCILECCCGC